MSNHCFSSRDRPSVIYKPIIAYVNENGKWIRPLLAYTGMKAWNYQNANQSQHLLAALQIMHGTLLLIDNIQDKQEIRHNKPTMHTTIGLEQTLNASILLMNESYKVLTNPLHEHFSKLKKDLYEGDISYRTKEEVLKEKLFKQMREITNCYRKTGEGQAEEIYYRDKVKLEKIREKITNRILTKKTGIYTGGTPLAMASIEAEVEEEKVNAARQIGIEGAIGFQIIDDINDLRRPSEKSRKWGKRYAEDLEEGKRTLPVANFVENKLGTIEFYKFKDLFGKGKGTLSVKQKDQLVGILGEAGSIKYSIKEAEKHVKNAISQIEKTFPQGEYRTKLRNLIEYFVTRRL